MAGSRKGAFAALVRVEGRGLAIDLGELTADLAVGETLRVRFPGRKVYQVTATELVAVEISPANSRRGAIVKTAALITGRPVFSAAQVRARKARGAEIWDGDTPSFLEV